MNRYPKTITFVLMCVIMYFAFDWIKPFWQAMSQDLGFRFYIVVGLTGGGAHAVAEGLVQAVLLTKQRLNGVSA